MRPLVRKVGPGGAPRSTRLQGPLVGSLGARGEDAGVTPREQHLLNTTASFYNRLCCGLHPGMSVLAAAGSGEETHCPLVGGGGHGSAPRTRCTVVGPASMPSEFSRGQRLQITSWTMDTLGMSFPEGSSTGISLPSEDSVGVGPESDAVKKGDVTGSQRGEGGRHRIPNPHVGPRTEGSQQQGR